MIHTDKTLRKHHGGKTDPRITQYMSGYRDLPAKISKDTGICEQDVKLMLDSLANTMLDELMEKSITSIPRFGVILLKVIKFTRKNLLRKKIRVIMQAAPNVTAWINIQELGSAQGRTEMKKQELITKIAELGDTAEANVVKVLDGLRQVLETSKEDVKLDGIGIFKYGINPAREGVNPLDGKKFKTVESPRYTFRTSDSLKKAMLENHLPPKDVKKAAKKAVKKAEEEFKEV